MAVLREGIFRYFQKTTRNVKSIFEKSDKNWDCTRFREIDMWIARCIPFKDEEFDLVIALDILEHIEDDDRCLLESHRVLEKQGKLIVTVPALPSLWSIKDKLLHHYRRYEEN